MNKNVMSLTVRWSDAMQAELSSSLELNLNVELVATENKNIKQHKSIGLISGAHSILSTFLALLALLTIILYYFTFVFRKSRSFVIFEACFHVK